MRRYPRGAGRRSDARHRARRSLFEAPRPDRFVNFPFARAKHGRKGKTVRATLRVFRHLTFVLTHQISSSPRKPGPTHVKVRISRLKSVTPSKACPLSPACLHKT